MKFSRKTHTSSCSCTSCIYKNESERSFLQRLVSKKSKFDRLHYGNHIPLREKKLLDKLVRTRAVYDDIRAQLLSGSGSSIHNADFNTSSANEQSRILEIVNLVDKGAAKTSMSECCSCCSCSKSNIHHNVHSRKQRHGHRNDKDRYRETDLRYNMKYNRGVRFPKHIKSDPCTCTFKFLGFNQRNANLNSNIESSLNIDEEIQPRPRTPFSILVDSKTKIRNKITDGLEKTKESKRKLQHSLAIHAKESLEKVKTIKNVLKPTKKVPEDDFYIEESRKVTILKDAGRPSYEKIKASQTRIMDKIVEGGEIAEYGIRQSVNKLKQTKNKINTTVKGSLERLNQKRKAKKKINILSPEQDTQLALKVRKDSIAKFREKLSRKQLLKDWTCDEPCIEGICDPMQCYQNLKLKRTQKERRHGHDSVISHKSKIKKRLENFGISSNSSNARIQTKSLNKALKRQTKMPMDITKNIEKGLRIKKNKDKQRLTNPPPHKSSKFYKSIPSVTSTLETSRPRQVVRIGSSFSFNVEFFKENTRPDTLRSHINQHKDTQSSGLALSSPRRQKTVLESSKKRSHNSLKLLQYQLAKKLRHKKKRLQTISQQKSESIQCQCPSVSSAERSQFNLLPSERFTQKRLATHTKQSYTSSRKTKSTSSMTIKSKSSKAKQVQSAIIPRRKSTDNEKLKLRPRRVYRKSKPNTNNVVRIGSKFSFNIEFSKSSRLPNQKRYDDMQDLNTFSIKPKAKPLVQHKKSKELKNIHRNERKLKGKTQATGAETMDYTHYIKTRDKSTRTKKLQYLAQLQPYECEPGTCIPGKCNPYQCLEIINKRHNIKDVGLATQSPENKSTYSYTNRSKVAYVQSTPRTRERKIFANSKIGDGKIPKPQYGSIALKNNARQAVNIGSSFSFNIEFAKRNTKKNIDLINQDLRPINFSTRKKVKGRGVEIEKKVGHVDTQVEKVGKAEKASVMGPMLKRCFCTLNLYKKHKSDNKKYKKLPYANAIYNVNTALLEKLQHSSVNLKNDGLIGKQCSSHIVPSITNSTSQSLKFTSSLNIKLIKSLVKNSMSSSNLKRMESVKLTGTTKYLKHCFCAMNMQYDNKFRNLEPYECEPGVCNPGQCDPYECQKLIMKRLLRGNSKQSSTDPKSISLSSSQTQKLPSQSQFASASLKPHKTHKKRYKPKPLIETGGKQAVRIGSTCSFSVEFNKTRSSDRQKDKIYSAGDSQKSKGIPKVKRAKYKNKKIITKYGIRESDSQVTIDTKHNECNVQDEGNRCFCTLKLHKKGKANMSIGQIQTTPYQQTGISVSRGQNTKGFTFDQYLLPYECEPGTCIPGECNPYDCLARINRKKFKESGIATVQSTTVSSNTLSKEIKTRAVKVKPTKSNIKPIRRVRGLGTRKLNKRSPNKRRAVKISSTFSFSIDFSKDTSNKKINRRKPSQSRNKETKQKGRKINTAFPKSHAKVLQTVQSQHTNMATMVQPFLKRCFCTLQLGNQHNSKVKPPKIREKKYRSVMTMTKEHRHRRKLDPNECEPGVCIPYRCDPFECEEIIKRRLNQELNLPTKLLPYECEPNFCIPGKCDPYVCLEHIKKRHMKTKLTNSKSIKSGIIPNLKRCFCTLSLKKNITKHDKSKIEEEETQTENQWPTNRSTAKNLNTNKSTISAVNTFIKNCLCTLKFNTRKVPVSPRVKLQINPQKQKNTLEPYECEPNTCIPGECNPYECKKRIRKRLLRETAAEPIRSKYFSKSTATPTLRAKTTRTTLAPLLQTNNYNTPRVNNSKKKSTSGKNVAKKEHASHNQDQNKQCVRIGSSFSFDIEFFKDRTGGNGDTPLKRNRKDFDYKSKKPKIYTKRDAKIGKEKGATIRLGQHNTSQLARLQTKSNSTLTDPMFNRCFCTLQLQKNSATDNQNMRSQRQQLQNPIHNKMTHTTLPYECPPYMCNPNLCDPYDCERKLKKINLRNQEVGSKEVKRVHQSSEMDNFPKQKSQKTQSNVIAKAQTHGHEQNIVEIPRLTNYFKKENRQGVKIGSNMSFNIEFYKEFSSPVSYKTLKATKNRQNVKSRSLKNRQVDFDVVRKKRFSDKVVPSKRLNVLNTGSQIHKRIDSKSSNTTNKLKRCFCTLTLQKTKTKPQIPYPQVFEVRRAMIKKYKGNPTKEICKLVNVQENGKNNKLNDFTQETHAKNNEMQTILSYKPKKFNKTSSKTLIVKSNIMAQSNKKRITWINKKRLTKKPSAHPINVSTRSCICNINTKPQERNQTSQEHKRSKREAPHDVIKSSYSDRRAKIVQNIPIIKTSNILMLCKCDKCKISKEEEDLNIHNLVGNQFESGDAKSKHIKSGCRCVQKSNKNRPLTQKDDTKHKSKPTSKDSKGKFINELKKVDSPCPFCGQCVNGGTGYFLLTKINYCMRNFLQWSPVQKLKTIAALTGNKEKKTKVIKPLFDVYLDADNLGIINKDEVTENVTRLQTKIGKREKLGKNKKHDKACSCCICLSKKGHKKGKSNKANNSKVKNDKGKNKKAKSGSIKCFIKKGSICVCGSEVCAKDMKRMKKRPPKKRERTPCFCGSPICAEETATINRLTKHPAACVCQEEYKKRRDRSNAKFAKLHILLTRKLRQKDSQRQKKHRKADQLLKKSLRGKNSNSLLVAETLVEVPKLVFTGISDVIRNVYRCIKYPKHTWHSLKGMAKDPSLIAKALKDTYSNSGVAARTRRMGMRISKISLKNTKQLLEQHAMSNYLLHINDKDPKKRLLTRKKKKKKKRKERERVDFNCNLFMSSLRKRPFMWVFDRCPWFYPHCLSLFNVWKQFAEVILFLLAAVVWSPCIFAMEVCRAFVCCTLCTG